MYHNVLVPLDGSTLAEAVLPHVDALVLACHPGRVILAEVVDTNRDPIASETLAPNLQAKLELVREKMERDEVSTAEQYLNNAKSRLQSNKQVETVIIKNAHPAETLLEFAQKNDVDLIMIASHGKSGESQWGWGKVADKILRGGCVPVFMAHAPGCGAEMAKIK